MPVPYGCTELFKHRLNVVCYKHCINIIFVHIDGFDLFDYVLLRLLYFSDPPVIFLFQTLPKYFLVGVPIFLLGPCPSYFLFLGTTVPWCLFLLAKSPLRKWNHFVWTGNFLTIMLNLELWPGPCTKSLLIPYQGQCQRSTSRSLHSKIEFWFHTLSLFTCFHTVPLQDPMV